MKNDNETSLPVGSDALVLPLRGWHHDRSQYADWGWIRDADGNLVADVKVPRGTDEAKHRREKTDPTEAISRLIAAAPDMLEALKGLKAILDFEDVEGANNAADLASLTAMVESMVDAALAKASGQNAGSVAPPPEPR